MSRCATGLLLSPLSLGSRQSEKDAKLAQKLGQLQPLLYYHGNARANLHRLGQPNTFLIQVVSWYDNEMGYSTRVLDLMNHMDA